MKSKSKEAFSHNVKTEMAAGRPLKQSLAIAYAEKHSAEHKKTAEHTEHPHHSRHSAERSEHYHQHTVDASLVRPSSTKMTRAEHQLNNMEDETEKGHKL